MKEPFDFDDLNSPKGSIGTQTPKNMDKSNNLPGPIVLLSASADRFESATGAGVSFSE